MDNLKYIDRGCGIGQNNRTRQRNIGPNRKFHPDHKLEKSAIVSFLWSSSTFKFKKFQEGCCIVVLLAVAILVAAMPLMVRLSRTIHAVVARNNVITDMDSKQPQFSYDGTNIKPLFWRLRTQVPAVLRIRVLVPGNRNNGTGISAVGWYAS